MDYSEFLESKSQLGGEYGFSPVFMPDMAFDFQKDLIEWSVKKGRSSVMADCGLGKSLIELAYAQNIVEKTNKNMLLLTPIAVGQQMEREAEKFGIEAKRSKYGKIPRKITITNYEQLHKYNPNDFEGLVCDESSILKNFDGKRKAEVTQFSRKMKYRLLATATAAPNDFIELGTSSEALGYLGYMDMLNKFFKNDNNNTALGRMHGKMTKWRLKGHAHDAFWKWVTSWGRALRKPSDLGYSDDNYILPDLIENDIMVNNADPQRHGMLFALPARGLDEQRKERRATIQERCEKAAEITNNSKDFTVVWCNLNDEGDLLEKLIPDAIQVSGKDNDDKKEDKLLSFSSGKSRVLITKPKIGAWGLNWQHCNHTIIFPTHSYEQYYQGIRRFFRFGQKRPVTVDRIYTDGETEILENLNRKHNQADHMFDRLVREMNDSLLINNKKEYKTELEVPSWL